jgi:hypothetical protein
VREIHVSQLESIIERPQCSAVRITDAGKAATRSCVRLEHNQRQISLLCEQLRVGIDANKIERRLMIEVGWEDILWVDNRAAVVELGRAVVAWIPSSSMYVSISRLRQRMPQYRPFNCQCVKSVLELINEASIPYLLWSPISSGNTGTQKHVLDGNPGVSINSIDEILDLVAVLLWRVGDTMLEPERRKKE